MRKAGDVKIWKKCPRNQLSQEMEQNDFTFLCTQRMSCRFKFTPSVNQVIRFSKQPQNVTRALSKEPLHPLNTIRLCSLHFNANRINVQVFVGLACVVFLLYTVNIFCLTLTFDLTAFMCLKDSDVGPSKDNNNP